jgi:hypothetical protein
MSEGTGTARRSRQIVRSRQDVEGVARGKRRSPLHNLLTNAVPFEATSTSAMTLLQIVLVASAVLVLANLIIVLGLVRAARLRDDQRYDAYG